MIYKSGFWLKGIGLLIPAFFIWKILTPVAFLPLMSNTIEFTLDIFDSSLSSKLVFIEGENNWVIDTDLFQASRPWSHNTYKPTLSTMSRTQIPVGKIDAYMLGIPLFWVLVLLISGKKIKHLIVGSLIMLGISFTSVSLMSLYKVLSLLSSEPLLRILTEHQYILLPAQPSSWLPSILKIFTDISGIIATLVAPAFLAYYFSRDRQKSHIHSIEAASEPEASPQIVHKIH